MRDEGDIAGLFCHAGPVVVEAKNVARLNLSGWVDEAETERGHADAAVGIVVHKRRGYGRGSMGDQYVTMRLEDKRDDDAPYFSVILVPGWETRP